MFATLERNYGQNSFYNQLLIKNKKYFTDLFVEGEPAGEGGHAGEGLAAS